MVAVVEGDTVRCSSFDRVLIYGSDRLGRNAGDLMAVRDRSPETGDKLVSAR